MPVTLLVCLAWKQFITGGFDPHNMCLGNRSAYLLYKWRIECHEKYCCKFFSTNEVLFSMALLVIKLSEMKHYLLKVSPFYS